MRLSKINSLLSMAALAWWCAGCTTSKLWEEGRFARFHQPADPPNLIICRSANGDDFLVEYDEVCDTSDKITRRAYWLFENEERILERHKPHYVSTESAKNLEVVPLDSDRKDEKGSATRIYAFYCTDDMVLTVVSEGCKLRECQLPVYADSTGTTKQIMLTPLSVAADVTIVGGVIGYYCLPGLGSALAYGFH